MWDKGKLRTSVFLFSCLRGALISCGYVQAPFLFAFAARGNLVNSYLGINYGAIIKWHRWLGLWTVCDIFIHGILYQVLLASDSASTWASFYRTMHYRYGASSMAGRISWGCMIIMTLLALPYIRRKFYWVRHLCY